MTRYKRRNYFIKKDFQGRLIFGYFLFVTGGCLLFLFMLAMFSADTLTISYSDHDLQLGQTPMMLLRETLTANWVLVIVGSVFLVIAAMLLTHRIAGPLFRFEKALDNMLAGRLDDVIRLRSKDEGKELADKLNDFNGQLNTFLRQVQEQTADIQQIEDELRTLISGQPDETRALNDSLHNLLQRLEQHTRTIEQNCSRFTLRDE